MLNTTDLISLGVGSCVGTGMYLVSGMVARTMAGPAVVLSYAIAGVASMFSGLCYAELGVRVPRTTGSAYVYSYVTVGEFIAFVIGWNMVGAILLAKGLSLERPIAFCRYWSTSLARRLARSPSPPASTSSQTTQSQT